MRAHQFVGECDGQCVCGYACVSQWYGNDYGMTMDMAMAVTMARISL